MSTKNIVSDIAECMGLFKRMGKDWGRLTITVGYSATRPDPDGKGLEIALAAMAQYFPTPLKLFPFLAGYFVDCVRISAEVGEGGFDFEFDLSGADHSKGGGSGE